MAHFHITIGWMRRHRVLTFSLLLLGGLIVLNVLAYGHARGMTHFAPVGARTRNPEALTSFDKLRVLLTGVTLPRPENTRTPAAVGLTFETVGFEGSGGTLEAWYVPRAESRAVVVMFHGYAACKDTLLEQAAVCHELGCAVLLVDLRGSGGSAGSVTTIGIREADDVAAAYQKAVQLQPGTPIVLYGMSMGSAAVLRACAVHDLAPAGLILESPFDRLLTTVGARFRSMGLPAFPGASLLVFWGGVQHGFNGFAHNPVEYAAQVRGPVLILHGGHDPRVTVAEARAVFERCPEPKHFELFESGGHEALLTIDPPRWRRAVDAALSAITK